ncbi:TPR-like protein [Colletotrichum tofieldiae]|uniref:TPR-like protein n=1 Tax=Colletotrichum tofieldiae TaxID=708197 RepID=A0A166UNW8_9PEZI|nr:TPR-like protein [Colletotrichum tofieldiae]
MPARMWRHGIHSFLELLRHRLPASLEHMLAFIYLARDVPGTSTVRRCLEASNDIQQSQNGSPRPREPLHWLHETDNKILAMAIILDDSRRRIGLVRAQVPCRGRWHSTGVRGIPAVDWPGGRESTRGRSLTHKTLEYPTTLLPTTSPSPLWFFQSHQRIISQDSKLLLTISFHQVQTAEVHQTSSDSRPATHHHCTASSTRH